MMRINQVLKRLKNAQDEDWYDSTYYESIQTKSRSL